uniref:ATP synthase complex subunit 8 n=1 Tax=Brontispa longissima TaxID=111217 RepID=A0A7T8V7T5_BROLO|nr:ATP synthase F0 subunit 8 [Brontispa longissima]QQQ89058.1 ATP synthase F0 subunit 8 [Brontispa longissima]UAJ48111.1 ATP synthase F0 subunit 8 [Brontispa longissima]URQ17579.1 ATP synthase F0 subunit 8 [Brontispa longissima]
MPQMAPLNWLSFMITMCLILMFYSSIWYFSFFSYPVLKEKKTNNKINWKW